MSSFIKNTKHPETGKWGAAAWIDDYFGPHLYGIRWLDSETVYGEGLWDQETNDDPVDITWDDFFPEKAMEQVTTESVLAERGSIYGNYLEQTKISGELRRIIRQAQYDHEAELKEDQEDALMMITVKISRILNGDPNYADNWRDIAGYATLVAERLEQK